MAQGYLPQELLNIIVDFAAYDSHESLQAMSLASRCFLDQSRQHLFRNLSFAEPPSAPGGGGGELGRCLGIMKCNASLFRYTRHLRLPSLSPSVLALEGDLRRILGFLTHLRGLSISLDLTTEGWLQEGLFGHRLTRLTIEFIAYIPSNVLYTLPHLQELRLDSENRIPDIQPQIDATRIPWKLKSLEYHPWTLHPPPLMLLTGTNSPVYAELSHLRLFISVQKHQNFVSSTILPACQKAPLKILDLVYPDAVSLSPPGNCALPLPSFGALKYLSVSLACAGFMHTMERVPCGMLAIPSALLSGSVQPALEAVDLIITSYIYKSHKVQEESGDLVSIGPGFQWEEVDTLLADKSRFPKLRAFRIHHKVYTTTHEVCPSTGSTPLAVSLRKQTLALLPRVKESGMMVTVGEGETQREYHRDVEPVSWRFH